MNRVGFEGTKHLGFRSPNLTSKFEAGGVVSTIDPAPGLESASLGGLVRSPEFDL